MKPIRYQCQVSDANELGYTYSNDSLEGLFTLFYRNINQPLAWTYSHHIESSVDRVNADLIIKFQDAYNT